MLEILKHLIPGCEVVIIGDPSNADEYATQVIWHDDRPQPSWDDIEANRQIVATKIANEQAMQARADDYRIEADPLFFGFQRGENSEQEWLDKVAEIRARHPYA